MKKVFGMILAIALSITSVMLGFSWLKFDDDKQTQAATHIEIFDEEDLLNKTDILNPEKLYATYANQQSLNKSPFDEKTEKLKTGYTFIPTENKNKEVNVAYFVEEFTTLPDKSIYMWIFIPNEDVYAFNLSFETTEGYSLSWSFTAYEFEHLIESKSTSEITYGWKLFEFCIGDAKKSAEITHSYTGYVFNKMSISYTAESNVYQDSNKNKLAFYHVYQADSFSSYSTIVDTIEYANYKIKEDFVSDTYFVDEEIYFTSVVDMFEYIYVGQTNLYESSSSLYAWVMEVVDANGEKHEKNFGEKFVFSKVGSHSINITIYEFKSTGSAAVVYIPIVMRVQNFIFGAFTDIDYRFEKDEPTIIYFKISSYFIFDEESILVFINDKKKADVTYYLEGNMCKITVTGLKKGDTSISVQIDGAKRGAFESKTYKSTTKIVITDEDAKSSEEVFVWVLLGVYAVGFGIFVVISLVKARRVGVK